MNQRVKEKHMKMIEEKAKYPNRAYWTQEVGGYRYHHRGAVCFYPSKNSIEKALDEQLP